MRVYYFIITFLLTLASLVSCDATYLQRGIEPYQWELDTTKIRLAHATIELSDFLNKLNITDFEKDSIGNIFFSYQTSFNTKSENFIDLSLEDQNYLHETLTPISETTFESIGGSPYTIPTGSPLAQDITLNDTSQHTVDISENLTGALFETGNLTLEINSTFDCEIEMSIKIPSISKTSNNNIFDGLYTIKKGQENIVIPLNEYRANLTHNGTSYDENTFNNMVILTESVFKFKEGNTIRNTDKIEIDTKLDDILMEVVFGDFGTKNFNITPEIIELDFFKDLQDYNIKLTNPKMIIEASNEFGFPIGIDVTNTEAKTNSASQFLTYTGISEDEKLLNNILIIEGVDRYEENLSPKITNRVIDNSNSNLKDLIGINPTELIFDLTGNTNPIDKAPNKNFYSKKHNNLNIDLSIDVPMEVNFDDVNVIENINLDLSIISSEITFVKIYVVTNNSIPLSGEVELQFYNNGVNLNLNKQASAFESAITDETGKSIESTENTAIFEFKEEDLSKLRRTTNIQLLLKLNTPDSNESVKIESDNKLELYIKSELAGKLNFSN
jgi:hypothetical protein